MNQNKIYIGNLPFKTTEDALRAAFENYGTIEDLVIIKDRETNRSKGFGFITFATKQEADASLEMNGKQFEDRSIRVSIAQEKKRSGGGGGGRW